MFAGVLALGPLKCYDISVCELSREDIMIQIIIQIGVGVGIAILLIFIINRIFNRLYRVNQGIHLKFFRSLANGLVGIITIYYCCSLFSTTKEITKLLLQSGTVIVALITFAAQQALGNVISGFSISMTKPYKVDDKVKVISGGSVLAEGKITDVTIRHTIIRTFDGQSAIIPNSVMDSSVIMNTNYTENVGNFLEIEISYGSNPDKAIDIMKRLILSHPLTINEEDTSIFVNRYTANGMVLKTSVWTKTLDDNFKACSDLRKSLVKEFAENSIIIPYQTITIDK